MGMGRWVWEEEPHLQRVLLAHSLWYVILGLRESSVWIILPLFTFCSHMLSHHHPTLIFMPIKSFSERIQPHQQCSERTLCSWSIFIPIMLQNQGTPSQDVSALAGAGTAHRHGCMSRPSHLVSFNGSHSKTTSTSMPWTMILISKVTLEDFFSKFELHQEEKMSYQSSKSWQILHGYIPNKGKKTGGGGGGRYCLSLTISREVSHSGDHGH